MANKPEIKWLVDKETNELAAYLVQPNGQRERVAWAPQPGSQEAFLSSPIFETLYEGTRGPGKTDALLMDFARGVDQGFGVEWKGIIFRHTYPDLQDVIDKSHKWFSQIYPKAKFNRAKYFWEWPTGEKLFFRPFEVPGDYRKYHGHAYPWLGWEELTQWPTDECFKSMFSTVRSTKAGMPMRVRATTNPFGVGHNWVKDRYKLPIPFGTLIGPIIKTPEEPDRVAIHGALQENKLLLHSDPEYINKLKASARSHAELRAWLHGDWTIVAGGMFDDLWTPHIHVVPNLPISQLPDGWELSRSYDHGSAKPFSVGWWATSNGEPVKIKGRAIGQVPGDKIRIAEWYGSTGKPNEGLRLLSPQIAQGMVEREMDWGKPYMAPGPADDKIFDDNDGTSINQAFRERGIKWLKADKSKGSRIHGWDKMRQMFKNALPAAEGLRESPGLFVCERCADFIRTIPVLPRDAKNMDDVDTQAEDHIGDETRYFLRRRSMETTQSDF